MQHPFALSVESPVAQAIGAPTVVDGIPVQRFRKQVIPQGRFVKRDKTTKVKIFELDVDRARQDQWVEAWKAMNTAGVPVRLMDDTGNYTLDAPKAPLTKDHEGVYETSRSKRLKKLADAVVADTQDLFVADDGWLTAIVEVRGQDQIDLCKRVKFTSPEIDPCFIDGTDKKYGEAITAISIVANPVIPGQTGFEPIAASADSPERIVLSLDTGDSVMDPKVMTALFTAIALAAGMEASKVTEANAADLVTGLGSKLRDPKVVKALSSDGADEQKLVCKMCGKEKEVTPVCYGCQSKTHAFSADSPEGQVVAMAARTAEGVVKTVLAGTLSEAGIAKLTARLVGDRQTKKFSTLMLSSDTADGAVDVIEAICKDIKENLAVSKGAKTEQQTTKAFSADENDQTAKTEEQKHADAVKKASEDWAKKQNHREPGK